MSVLPAMWEVTNVGSVLRIQYGKGLSKDERDESGHIPVYGSAGRIGSHSSSLVDGPVVVIGRKGGVGATYLEPKPCWPIDTTYFAQIPEGTNPAFLAYQLQSLPLASLDTSTAIPSLRREDLESQTLVIPPETEQEQIVAVIDEQFSRLDAGVEVLEQVRQNIRRYRVSLLKTAMRGELSSLPSKTTAISKWERTTIGCICECLDSRRRPINKKDRLLREGSVPYFGANGQVGWIDDYLFDEPLVLVVEDETFTGRIKPFSYKISGKSWVNNHAHVLRATPRVSADFLNYALAYYPFTPLTTGTTGRKKLTKKALLNAPIVLPPREDQDSLVDEIGRCMSGADRIEAKILTLLKSTAVLRSSILKSAFSAKLVPQSGTNPCLVRSSDSRMNGTD